ncbi:MAG TPA: tetratricopeptide repeat protein [Candidatus Saccharimonadales bacterium]|nr:tetratricopeptide repeat protein [Candidatus Saccharimonadales bacterium]
MKKIIILSLVLFCIAAGVVIVISQKPVVPQLQPDKPSAPPIDLAALKAKAEAGDAAAQTSLGEIYEQGNGVTQDMKEAVKWFRKAADQNYPDALALLGEMTQAGQGVKADPAAAAQLYTQAAEKGSVAGQYNLAYLYEQGIGVEKNEAKASKWYQLAAEGGDPLAQFDIGQRYNLGMGVKADKVQACKWLSLAAAQGQSDSMQMLHDLKSQMSADQIAEADKLVKEFIPRESKSATQGANP